MKFRVEGIQTVYSFPGYNITGDTVNLLISMDRNPTFYVVYLLLPALLSAFVSVLVFLLPPDCGERVGLSVTMLLSYSVFLLMVSEFTPRGGNDMAVLGGLNVSAGLLYTF